MGWDGEAWVAGHLPGRRQTQCRVCDGAGGCVPKGLAVALLPFLLPSFGPHRWRLPVGVDGSKGALKLRGARPGSPVDATRKRYCEGAPKVRDRGPLLVCFDVSFESRELSCFKTIGLLCPTSSSNATWMRRKGWTPSPERHCFITPGLFLRDPCPELPAISGLDTAPALVLLG